MNTPQPLSMEEVGLEIDLRLTDIFGLLFEMEQSEEGVSREQLAGIIRMAYCQGHTDAFTSQKPDTFYTDLGYSAPKPSNGTA